MAGLDLGLGGTAHGSASSGEGTTEQTRGTTHAAIWILAKAIFDT